MRNAFLALMMLSLAACNRGLDNNKDAVRQGLLDYLSNKGFNINGMSVDVTSVTFNGTHADAVVSFTPKGGPKEAAMTMPYRLEQTGGKWVVIASAGTHPGANMPADGSNPHGGGMPSGDNPHGGMAPAGGGSVPSPEDLPPVKKK